MSRVNFYLKGAYYRFYAVPLLKFALVITSPYILKEFAEIIMELEVLVLGVISGLLWATTYADIYNHTETSANITRPDKDMYVIHATVYQVGILTNRTDNKTDNFNSTGNQESVTLYHSNGTNIDFSDIPEPFLTNVTAQTLVGVAPVSHIENENVPAAVDEEKPFTAKANKRSLDNFILFKRDTTSNTPVKVTSGAAVIPSEVGVQSISLPPLMSFNNNMTKIPVPIPNTSVIHYAKVNTLVQKP